MTTATPRNHPNTPSPDIPAPTRPAPETPAPARPAPAAVDTSGRGGPTRHEIEWTAAGLCRAAAESDVTLPVDYARRVAAAGLGVNTTLGVTRLGAGVVIHTQPATNRQLPIVVGYADRRGQWYRDGSRHIPTSTDTAGADAERRIGL